MAWSQTGLRGWVIDTNGCRRSALRRGHKGTGGWQVANDASGANVNRPMSRTREDLEKLAGMAWLTGVPARRPFCQSNPLRDFGIDRLIEEISRNLGPFGAPLAGPLIGLQFRKPRGDIRTAVDEVAQHPQLRTLRRDRRDRGLRFVDAPGGRQARTKQTTRSQQRLWAAGRRGSIDPLLRPPAGELLLVRIIGRHQQPDGRCFLKLHRDLVDRVDRLAAQFVGSRRPRIGFRMRRKPQAGAFVLRHRS